MAVFYIELFFDEKVGKKLKILDFRLLILDFGAAKQLLNVDLETSPEREPKPLKL